MSISLTEDFKTVEELSTQSPSLLEQLKQTGRPIVVTQDGEPAAVLLDVKRYEWIIHLLTLSRTLNEGMEDVRAGRTKPAEQVFRELGLGKKKKVASERPLAARPV